MGPKKDTLRMVYKYLFILRSDDVREYTVGLELALDKLSEFLLYFISGLLCNGLFDDFLLNGGQVVRFSSQLRCA